MTLCKEGILGKCDDLGKTERLLSIHKSSNHVVLRTALVIENTREEHWATIAIRENKSHDQIARMGLPHNTIVKDDAQALLKYTYMPSGAISKV